MKNKIVYEGRTFEATDIKSGNLFLATSLMSSQLQVNSFKATVKCDDTSITNFERNSKLEYYYKNRQIGIFRVQNIRRAGPDAYEISATSTLGLLTEGRHMGGIYTGQTAEEVIASICEAVPFAVKNNLKGIKLYGWLPIAAPRDNLAQVLFAIGAALKTDLDGVLRIESLWDGISGTVDRDRIYNDATVDYDGKITQVIVLEHQYVPWTEEKQLFEGTAQEGDIITFDDPMHDLTADGFSILASGANWAKVSAGSGTLTGRTYLHNTRQISKDVWSAQEPNIKTVKDATLVSLTNSKACAQRLADYYKFRERVDASVVYRGEAPGDRLSVFHPFDKIGVAACLESADITLSNTLKAQEKSLVGFVPKQMEQAVTYDHMEVLIESGTWTVPEEVADNEILAVCIGGGNGGPSGFSGKPNQPNATSPHSESHQFGGGDRGPYRQYYRSISPSKGGDGGDGSEGALGGKVYSTTIQVTPGQTFVVHIGAGGIGGNGEESTDDETVPGDPGEATTFGSISSDSGSSSPYGFLEEITGVIYAGKGDAGISGSPGVSGYGESYYDDFWGQTSMRFAYTVPEPLVFEGASYEAGQAQDGMRAYGSEWGSLDNSIGLREIGYGRGLGGGAAAGKNGPSSDDDSRAGAPGAKPIKPPVPAIRGCGGHGGHGGGGAGGAGGAYSEVNIRIGNNSASSTPPNISNYASATPGGAGGDGGDGAPGCVIIYYGVRKKMPSGQLVDRKNRMVLDRLGRRIIV